MNDVTRYSVLSTHMVKGRITCRRFYSDAWRLLVLASDYDALAAERAQLQTAWLTAGARIAALEAALRQYWEARSPAAMAIADAVAKKLLLTPAETNLPPTCNHLRIRPGETIDAQGRPVNDPERSADREGES